MTSTWRPSAEGSHPLFAPMAPAELRELRKRLELTQAQLGEALDLSRRRIVLYEGGNAPIPRTVALACEALLARAQAAD